MGKARTIEELLNPQHWKQCSLTHSRIKKGPYKEMTLLELGYSCQNNEDKLLLKITFFEGRPPYYPAWVEIHEWNPELYGRGTLKETLQILYEILPKGSRIFLEYSSHTPTRKMLEKGHAPEDTPLGKLLLDTGFTKLRDLYYPEGFREGGPKLLAYKT